MAPVAYKQDMPPPGGYAKIVYERNPCRRLFGTWSLFGLFVASTTYGCIMYYWNLKRKRMLQLEMGDAKIALEPILTAERDRAYLKQIISNRDTERELMKDVPGWEVGTWYGEPIYKTVSEEKWIDPIMQEYYAFGKYGALRERFFFKQMN